MLVLPMRLPTPSPTRQLDHISSNASSRHDQVPQTPEPRQRASMTQRPKLSLQTTISHLSTSLNRRPSLNPMTPNRESPTLHDTYANSFDAPPPIPSSPMNPYIDFPTPSTSINTANTPATSWITPGHISPFLHEVPYVLPIGTYSILRNSPLRKRHLSAASTRNPKRIFPPVKRVVFQDKSAEVIPTPVIESSDDEADEDSGLDERHGERKAVIEAEDGHLSADQSRSKRRREWIWRPMPYGALDEGDNENAIRKNNTASNTARNAK